MKTEIVRLKKKLLVIRQRKSNLNLMIQQCFAWSNHWVNFATSAAIKQGYSQESLDGRENKVYHQCEIESYTCSKDHLHTAEEYREEILKLDKQEKDILEILVKLGEDVLI